MVLVKPRTLLIATAIIEFAAGIPLLITPSGAVQVLLGSGLPSPASLLVARVGGAALLAIGVSCWLERARPAAAPATGLVGGLLVYNAAVFMLMIYAALVDGLNGIGIWPACGLHLTLTAWCMRVIRAARRERAQHRTGARM